MVQLLCTELDYRRKAIWFEFTGKGMTRREDGRQTKEKRGNRKVFGTKYKRGRSV